MLHHTLPSTSQRIPSVMPGAKPSAKTLPFVSLPVSISTSKTRICDGPPSVKPVKRGYPAGAPHTNFDRVNSNVLDSKNARLPNPNSRRHRKESNDGLWL